MRCRLVLFNLILCSYLELGSAAGENDDSGSDELGGGLVSQLRNDANLDLSVDEEYEDLRAELLAYHTALASLASARRSVVSTPCWALGGICIHYKLCTGARYITEIPGCKDKLNVCCFAWNRFRVRDMQDQGINSLALPWSVHTKFGGKGVVLPNESPSHRHEKSKHKNNDKTDIDADDNQQVALIIAGDDSGEALK